MLKTIRYKTLWLETNCFRSFIETDQYLSSDLDLAIAPHTRHFAPIYAKHTAAIRATDRMLFTKFRDFQRDLDLEKS